LAGGKSVFIPTTEASGFKVTAEMLKRHVTDRTKLLVLNSPSNPTGTVYSPEELAGISKFVKEHGLLTISDEIYEKLIYDKRPVISFGAIDAETKKLTITVNGHSKSYAMTGWRIGYLACEKTIAQAVAGLQSHSTSNPTSFAQAGAVEAFKLGPGEIDRLRESFEKRRNLIVREVEKIKRLSFFKPQGAFYLFVNIARTGLGSVDFCEKLLDMKKVACVPGIAFGSDQHIRLSFAISEANITEGVRRIGEFVESL